MPPDSASDASDEAPSSPEGSEEPALLYRVPIHEWDESDQPREKLLTHGPTVLSDADVADVYGPLLRDLDKEVFKVVHLNTANVIIGDYTVSEGGLSSSAVEPRGVFEQAILDDAATVICLHNHPPGNPEPSREDIRITRQLAEAGGTMGIPVHDHLIIAGTKHTSLAERGVID
ncbi:JAB domain-containing protein [Salinibacter ruber]|uniref:JAB domain-containing protein n=1 Tax=Salinibacter ruber TaxID=146919 RepID=UPI0018462FCC|nr:JAB domain-containing protein [Salinibacter ruber]MBB4088571.1 DNA repair protein RadC [Salinibacter ruber]